MPKVPSGEAEWNGKVKTQIRIAVSVYVLVAIVKKRLGLEASLYRLMQLLLVKIPKNPVADCIVSGRVQKRSFNGF